MVNLLVVCLATAFDVTDAAGVPILLNAFCCFLVNFLVVCLATAFDVTAAAGAISLSSFNSFAMPGWAFSIDLTNAFLPIGSKFFILSFALFLT